MSERRDFFKHFIKEFVVLTQEASGHRHFKLSDLWKLDESKFRQLVFRVRPGVVLQRSERDIRAKTTKEPVVLCTTGTDQETLFRLMQQRLSVGDMVERLKQDNHETIEETFQTVRSFLLFLVQEHICIPANDVYYEPDKKQEADS